MVPLKQDVLCSFSKIRTLPVFVAERNGNRIRDGTGAHVGRAVRYCGKMKLDSRTLSYGHQRSGALRRNASRIRGVSGGVRIYRKKAASRSEAARHVDLLLFFACCFRRCGEFPCDPLVIHRGGAAFAVAFDNEKLRGLTGKRHPIFGKRCRAARRASALAVDDLHGHPKPPVLVALDGSRGRQRRDRGMEALIVLCERASTML